MRRLSCYQSILLRKAFSFPSVKRLVYTTGSVHAQENEEVVQSVLKEVSTHFKLVDALPSSEQRGLDGYKCGPMCVRFAPTTTMTAHLFVACFERIKDGVLPIPEENNTWKGDNGLPEKKAKMSCVIRIATPAKIEQIKIVKSLDTVKSPSNCNHGDKNKKKKKRKRLPLK